VRSLRKEHERLAGSWTALVECCGSGGSYKR
jgi:hypothetical protein